MTNWEKMKDSIYMLADGISEEDFIELFSNAMPCSRFGVCSLREQCDHALYKHDENGDVIFDEFGDEEVNPKWSCEDMLKAFLDKEVDE